MKLTDRAKIMPVKEEVVTKAGFQRLKQTRQNEMRARVQVASV